MDYAAVKKIILLSKQNKTTWIREGNFKKDNTFFLNNLW
jgi:hypothetical protein